MIGVEIAQLRKIPHVVGVVSGNDRSAAILAAIAGGIIKALVIDEAVAAALLAATPPSKSKPARKEAKS